MLASLGEEPTALGVARRYAAAGAPRHVRDGPRRTRSLAGGGRGLGLEVAVTDTVMGDVPARSALAREVLGAPVRWPRA